VSARIVAWAMLIGGEARAFDARARLPERKHLKLMRRSVRLGVGAALAALERRPGWREVPPERRGLFVGARPEGSVDDLREALQASAADGEVDAASFGRSGLHRVPPLWLVAGLSNNIVGYTTAYADLRGPVSNRCEGRVGGLAAVIEAARAVAEGRVDLAVAGGADDLCQAPPWLTHPTGEGAAFVVIERGVTGREVRDGAVVLGDVAGPEVDDPPDLGAAHGVVRLVRALQDPQAATVRVHDRAAGVRAWISLGAAG